MHKDRALERTLAVWIPVIVLLHLAGGVLLSESAWGVHLYRFLPPAVWVLSTLVLILIHVLSRQESAPLCRAVSRLPDPTTTKTSTRRGAFVLVSFVAGAVFWLARAGHTLLGDGNAVVLTLPVSDYLHPRSPLAQLVLRLSYDIARAGADQGVAPATVAQKAVAASSVVAGMLFVPVAWALARELTTLGTEPGAAQQNRRTGRPTTRHAATTWLLASIILTQGYMQLFFGYVENYTFYLLALGVYLWAGLRYVRGRGPFIWPALTAGLAFAVHFSGAVVFPSLLALAGMGLARTTTRRGAIRDSFIVLALGVVLIATMAWLGNDYQLLEAFGSVFRQAVVEGGGNLDYMWSAQHLRDFANQQLLIGPLGLALFIPGVFVALRAHTLRSHLGVFLVLVAGSTLGASWIASEPYLVLGYAREWDMLAPPGLVFTVTGLALFLMSRRRETPITAPLLWAVAISLFHTVPWIAVNASGPRSVERMKTLPLGQGRAATTVGIWYMESGSDAEAIEWFQRALQEYPRAVNAWDKLGLVYARQDRMTESADAYLRAISIRSDKIEYRRNAVEALRLSGRFDESLPHIEWLCTRDPANLDYWLRWTTALGQTGRSGEVRGVLERALAGLSKAQAQAPQDYFANFNLGAILMALDRPADALVHFQIASRVNSDSDLALVNIGAALVRLGRGAEARPYLEQAHARTADTNVRESARALLETSRTP